MRMWKRTLVSSLGVCLLLVISGCGGGSSSVPGCAGSQCTGCSGALCPVPAGSIYVLSGSFANQIYQFSQTASGAVPPTATIKGPSTVTDNLQGLGIDAAGNIYVGDGTTNNGFQILVYPPGANGPSKPSKTIQTTLQNAMSAITSLEVDAAGNIYASAFGEIAVFSPTANGSFAQSRLIGGPATTLADIAQMAVDSADNLYVANRAATDPHSVLIFNSAANGNVAPTATIGGSKTMIDGLGGVALDSAGNIYVVTATPVNTPAKPQVSLLEFSAGSTGDVAPMRTITGSSTNLDGCCFALRVDSQGNIYGLSNGSRILKFASNATGNVAPELEIDTDASILGESFGTNMVLH